MNRVNVPQLRFKGFQAEWKNCLLNDITKYVKGFAFKSEDYQENGVRIVRVSDLSADRIKNDNEKVFIDEDKSKVFDKYKLSAGNIVITTVGSKPEMIESAVGRGIYIHNDNEGLLNQNMLKFENIKNVTNGYIIGLINTKRYQHYMKSIARGNANQANITVVDLLQYQVSIPTLPEQQKIASFLSAVDEKIQQLSRKKELLQQYKKGIMQQLFSGKLRFKDENGNHYADWEEKKLGDVGKIITGSTPPTSNLEYYNGNQLFVSPADINGARYVLNTKTTLTDLGFEKGRKLKKGTVLFVCIGSTIGKVAIAGLDCITNQQINAIEANPFNSNDFIFSLLELNAINIKLLAGVQAVPQINKTAFSNFKFMFPCLKEQRKVAVFLSSIDAKIESVNQQITQTQSFKKGLLQQMFV
jgi:type I restriction enzyme S subunit